jgi:hypothetical protein
VTDQVGVEFGAVEQAADGLRRRLLQIEEGSGRSAEVFGQLGVDIRDANGQMRSMDSLMPDVIAGLAKIENETERSAKAMQIFGRSASNLAPLLAQGEAGIEALTARAHELGLVMGDESVAELVAFKDMMAEVKQQAGAVARQFGMVLLPIIKNDLIPIIREELVPAIRSAAQWFADLDDRTKKIALGLGALAASAGPIMMAVGAIGKLTTGIRMLTLAMLSNPYTAIGVGLLALGVYAMSANKSIGGLADELRKEIDPKDFIDPNKYEKTFDRIVARTDELRDKLDELRAANQRDMKINAPFDESRAIQIATIKGEIKALEALQIEYAEMRALLAQTNKETEDFKNTVNELGDTRPIRIFDEDVTDEMVDLEESLKRILGIAEGPLLNMPEKIFPPGSLGAIRDEIAAINQEMRFLSDPDIIQEYQEQIKKLEEKIKELTGDQVRKIGKFEIAAVRATASFAKGLADSVVFAKDLKSTLGDIIKQLASKALQQFIMMALTGGTSAGAGITGGLLGRIFGVGDALIKSNGDVVQFHPNDNLMAWQGANMPSGGSKSITLNIPIVVDGQAVWTANRNFEIDL